MRYHDAATMVDELSLELPKRAVTRSSEVCCTKARRRSTAVDQTNAWVLTCPLLAVAYRKGKDDSAGIWTWHLQQSAFRPCDKTLALSRINSTLTTAPRIRGHSPLHHDSASALAVSLPLQEGALPISSIISTVMSNHFPRHRPRKCSCQSSGFLEFANHPPGVDDTRTVTA